MSGLMKAKIGGRVIRVEVVRAGKLIVHTMTDHNVITDAGMQFILYPPEYTDGYYPDRRRLTLDGYAKINSYPTCAGGLYYAQFGSGTTPASVTDSALENFVQESTARYSDGILGVHRGTKVSIIDGMYVQEELRTHEFTSTSSFSLSEVGYFGQLGSDAKTMFAHVLLSSPIAISSGDIVRVTYNLRSSASCTVSAGEVDGHKFQCRMTSVNVSYDTWVDTNSGLICSNRNDGASNVSSLRPDSMQLCGSPCFSKGPLYGSSAYFFGFNATPTAFPVDAAGRPGFNDISTVWFADSHFYGTLGSWSIGQNYVDFSLTFDDTIVQNFYYIRVKGWDFRFGYIDSTTGSWVDDPIVKDATHRLKLTFRTTVERE